MKGEVPLFGIGMGPQEWYQTSGSDHYPARINILGLLELFMTLVLLLSETQ